MKKILSSFLLVAGLLSLVFNFLPGIEQANANSSVDKCDERFTYGWSNANTNVDDSRVSINVHGSDSNRTISVTAKSGYEVTDLDLDDNNTGNGEDYNGGDRDHFNPSNIDVIYRYKVEVKKVCTEDELKKVDWCHKEPNGNFQTLNISINALQNAGHMDASGNPLHAGDYPGACVVLEPTPTDVPEPTPTEVPTPTPTEAPDQDPTPTPTPTDEPQAGKTSVLGYDISCNEGDFIVTFDLKDNGIATNNVLVTFNYNGLTKQATTNMNGRASVSFPQQGSYDVKATPEGGYNAQSMKVNMPENCPAGDPSNDPDFGVGGLVLGVSTAPSNGQVLGVSTMANTGVAEDLMALSSLASGILLLGHAHKKKN